MFSIPNAVHITKSGAIFQSDGTLEHLQIAHSLDMLIQVAIAHPLSMYKKKTNFEKLRVFNGMKTKTN